MENYSVTESYQEIQHRIQYLLLVQQCASLVSVSENGMTWVLLFAKYTSLKIPNLHRMGAVFVSLVQKPLVKPKTHKKKSPLVFRERRKWDLTATRLQKVGLQNNLVMMARLRMISFMPPRFACIFFFSPLSFYWWDRCGSRQYWSKWEIEIKNGLLVKGLATRVHEDKLTTLLAAVHAPT
jgi:hypothetical protein